MLWVSISLKNRFVLSNFKNVNKSICLRLISTSLTHANTSTIDLNHPEPNYQKLNPKSVKKFEYKDKFQMRIPSSKVFFEN